MKTRLRRPQKPLTSDTQLSNFGEEGFDAPPLLIACTKASANQMRLMLHGCAYWIWWTLRAACPKRSQWRHAKFDTLRLHLVKLAATIVEKERDRHDIAGFMPTTVADQAAIGVAAAASANLTLHNTPRPPQTPNQDSTDHQKHPMQNQGKTSRALLKLERLTTTRQPPKQGARELLRLNVICNPPNPRPAETKIPGINQLRQRNDPSGTSLDAAMRILIFFVARQE